MISSDLNEDFMTQRHAAATLLLLSACTSRPNVGLTGTNTQSSPSRFLYVWAGDKDEK
jgi:hypothetical protein